MIVAKFGGTSVGNAESLQQVKEIIASYPKKRGLCVVVSAFSGVTNLLIEAGRQASGSEESYQESLAALEKRHLEMVHELIGVRNQTQVLAEVKKLLNELEDLLHGVYLLKELSPRSMDLIYSFGERLSALIITNYLRFGGFNTVFVDARKMIVTNDQFGSARVISADTRKAISATCTDPESIYVVTGFIGSTKNQETTTLGRGGSDYTAALVAEALHADRLDIWTDVDGVLTADPRKVPQAFPLSSITYQEAMELSHFGAKVIYPPTIQPLVHKKIPIYIKNTFDPSVTGTLITHKGDKKGHPVKGITSIDNITLITLQGAGMIGVPGISARLFSSLARNGVNIILITQASSEHSITFAITPGDSVLAEEAINQEFELEIKARKIDKARVTHDLSIVAIIGENMQHTTGISGRLFGSLGINGVNVVAIAQGSSERNLSVVISRFDLDKALNILHESFFLSDRVTLNLFFIGAGLIGKTMLTQMANQQQYLSDEKKINLNLRGLINTKKQVLADRIPFAEAYQQLTSSEKAADLDQYLDQVFDLNLPNSVIIDCTSSKGVVDHYYRILDHNISIVTPSKIANSDNYKLYQSLRDIAEQRGVKFMYETNVGAGLPVIRTLEDLKLSGDKILKIEGVLSGTLSYIFNSFVSDTRFSEIVADARARGYTEPDPRDDLNGLDVARKILILSRDAGYKLELKQVSVENLIPKDCRDSQSADEFLEKLAAHDDEFSKLRDEAEASGKKLRYIATLDQGKATVGLQAVGPDHPLFPLSGSDNMISFTTERYQDRPLIIKGPGAGAEVTAAGVFAEIISLGNFFK